MGRIMRRSSPSQHPELKYECIPDFTDTEMAQVRDTLQA